MSPQAKEFLAANRRSPVVSGSAIGSGGQGAWYELRSGVIFKLTAEECREIGMPWWLGQPKPLSDSLEG